MERLTVVQFIPFLLILIGIYQTCAQNILCKQKDRSCFNSSLAIPRHPQQEKNKASLQKDKTACSSNLSCPPWFYCSNKSSECKCGQNHHHIIRCIETPPRKSMVLDCYCVTFDESRNTTVVGACLYNCERVIHTKDIHMVYHKLPNNISELNHFMCGRFNRTGPLCGQCIKDNYPLVYSYNLSCVYCPDGHKNWWKFILAAFVPLTFFYFLVIIFQINATSSHLHGFVFFAQVISITPFVRIALPAFANTPKILLTAKILAFFYSIWNLDFFRALVGNICLKTTTLQTLALDYVIAVYPLILMIISYVLIELHDRNFKFIVFIWKPFRFFLQFFRRNWDSRTSVIDAYATFFLLSFTKFLTVSFDILVPAPLYQLHSRKRTLVLFYDGSIEYFGKEHLPYAILAILVLFVFIAAPLTILFLYQFKFFQKFLSCFPRRWCNILHTFIDSFLGCYKDGTEPGTRDYRYFAVLFLLARIFSLILYLLTIGAVFFQAAAFLWVLFAVMMTAAQPFKKAVSHFTQINVFYVLWLVMLYVSISGLDTADIKELQFHKPFVILISVVSISPLFYISFITIKWLYTQRKCGKNFLFKFRAWRQGYDWRALESDQDFEDSLPDRMVNPNQYHEGNLSSFTAKCSLQAEEEKMLSIATY